MRHLPGHTDMDSDGEADDVLPESLLATRLYRRGTEPIGVIDVRHPQDLYARTAQWIAQRFPLLAYFMTRYGSGESETAGHGGFVYTRASERPGDEPNSLVSIVNHTPQVFEQPLGPMSRWSEEVSLQPAETFRVSRRPPPALAGTLPHGSFGLQSGEGPASAQALRHEARDGFPVVLPKEMNATSDLPVSNQSNIRQTSPQETQQASDVRKTTRSVEVVGSASTPMQPMRPRWKNGRPASPAPGLKSRSTWTT